MSRLEDLCELIVDCKNRTPPVTKNAEEAVGHAIGTPDILNGRIVLDDDKRVNQETYDTWTQRAVPRLGDVVLTREAPVGRVGLVESNMKVCLGQRTMLLRADRNRVDPRYLAYLLMGPQVQNALHSRASGSTVSHLRLAQVRELPLPEVPPLHEQQAIAEVLGSLDEKIVVNERIADTALALAKARVQAVEHTAPIRLSDVADVFDGPHATPQKTIEGPWFLSISSLKGGVLDLVESAHLTEDDFLRWTRRVQPSEGDVLFSYETRLGEAALMPPGVRASLGRRMGLLRPKPGAVTSVLLLHAYLNPPFQEEIRRRTVHGATVDRIPLKEMPTWPITLPVVGVRDQLSAALAALHASIDQMAVENRTLAELRNTLLPQLVTGKIRVKDAVRVVEDVAS